VLPPILRIGTPRYAVSECLLNSVHCLPDNCQLITGHRYYQATIPSGNKMLHHVVFYLSQPTADKVVSFSSLSCISLPSSNIATSSLFAPSHRRGSADSWRPSCRFCRARLGAGSQYRDVSYKLHHFLL